MQNVPPDVSTISPSLGRPYSVLAAEVPTSPRRTGHHVTNAERDVLPNVNDVTDGDGNRFDTIEKESYEALDQTDVTPRQLQASVYDEIHVPHN